MIKVCFLRREENHNEGRDFRLRIGTEAGMLWALEWLRPIVDDGLKIAHAAAGDLFSHM